MKFRSDCPPGGGLRRIGATTLALTFFAGCGSPALPKPDEVQVKQFAGQGYLGDDHYGIATSFSTWTRGDNSFDVALTVPAKPGQLPLVIYLPALGESRSAGEAWRTAWAQGDIEMPAMGSAKHLAQDRTPAGSVQSMTSQAISLAAIQGVITAFLDAYVKNDAVAKEWLDRDARRWLRDKGEILRK